MTNAITVFNFNNKTVRTAQLDNEPWFCLADACKVLELKNSRMATSVKDVKTFYTPTKGGKQNISYINEPNLYRLIFRSNKPQAQAFADWVYSEVLPSIRKTGKYAVDGATSTAIATAEQYAPVDMKALGGLVKRCAAVAVREEISALFGGEPEKDAAIWQELVAVILANQAKMRHKAILAENEELKAKLKQVKRLVR